MPKDLSCGNLPQMRASSGLSVRAPGREKILAAAVAIYAASTLTSMAVMSIGTALLLAAATGQRRRYEADQAGLILDLKQALDRVRTLEEALPHLIGFASSVITGKEVAAAKEYWQLILGPMLLLIVLYARGGIDSMVAGLRRG